MKRENRREAHLEIYSLRLTIALSAWLDFPSREEAVRIEMVAADGVSLLSSDAVEARIEIVSSQSL